MSTRPQPFNLPPGTNRQFQVNGHHYTSLNRSSLPPDIPSYTDMPQSPTPSQLCSRLWSADRYPYLSFSLQFPFVGQWARFATPVSEIQLTHDRYGWHLPRDIQREWKHFEQLIRANAQRISDYLLAKFSELTGLWEVPEKPGSFGYFGVQSTELEARQAIAESIDAFVVYLAYTSFLIALYHYYPQSSSTSHSSLSFRQLIQSTGLNFHPEWLNGLEDSPVAQFRSDPQRVGSIIDVKSCKWLNLVPCMIAANVPIWLHWGCPPFLTANEPRSSWTSLYMPVIDNGPPYSSFPVPVVKDNLLRTGVNLSRIGVNLLRIGVNLSRIGVNLRWTGVKLLPIRIVLTSSHPTSSCIRVLHPIFRLLKNILGNALENPCEPISSAERKETSK